MKMKNHLTRAASLAAAVAACAAPMLLAPSASAADASSLPDHIVNGDFEYPHLDDSNLNPDPSMDSTAYIIGYMCPSLGRTCNMNRFITASMSPQDQTVDAARFGWKGAQEWMYDRDTTGAPTRVDSNGVQQAWTGEDGVVEFGAYKPNTNQEASLIAGGKGSQIDQSKNGYIYQDVNTSNMAGELYTWSIDYESSEPADDTDHPVNVLIGAPGRESAQPADRVKTFEGSGLPLGFVGTTISSPKGYSTFQGSYVIPEGQDVTRFTFQDATTDSGSYGGEIDNVSFKVSSPLTYDINGASGSAPHTGLDTQTGIYDNYAQHDVPHALIKAGEADEHGWTTASMTMEGAHFAGWSLEKHAAFTSDADAAKVVVDSVTINKPTTVYAVWVQDIKPRISYDTNLPQGATLAQGVTAPVDFVGTLNQAPTPDASWTEGATDRVLGWRFDGWYAQAQGGDKYDFTKPLTTASTTVYAHWTQLTATVRYDANGGSGSHDPATVNQYTDFTIPSDLTFTRDGYTLEGFTTGKDGTGTVYHPGDKLPVTDGDVTLYAKWKVQAVGSLPKTGAATGLIAGVGGGAASLVALAAAIIRKRRLGI